MADNYYMTEEITVHMRDRWHNSEKKYKQRYTLRQSKETKTFCIQGLVNHHVVRAPVAEPEIIVHALKRQEIGSKNHLGSRASSQDTLLPTMPKVSTGGGKVRFSRDTTWYCVKCKVGFHPGCFEAWHQLHSASYSPPLCIPIRVQEADDEEDENG